MKVTRRTFLLQGSGLGALVLGEKAWSAPNRRLRVGLVGLGTRGKQHLSALRHSALAELAGVCDINPAVLARHHNILNPVPTYCSVNHLLANRDIDVIAVGLAPSRRYELIESAIRAGKHVVVDAPFVSNLAEARQLLQTIESADSLVWQTPRESSWEAAEVEALLPVTHLGQIRTVTIHTTRTPHSPASPLTLSSELELGVRLLRARSCQRIVALALNKDLVGASYSCQINVETPSLTRATIRIHIDRVAPKSPTGQKTRIEIQGARGTHEFSIGPAPQGKMQPADIWAAPAAALSGDRESWKDISYYSAFVCFLSHGIKQAHQMGSFNPMVRA